MMSAPLYLAILIYTTTLWSPGSTVQDVYIYKSNLRQQGKLRSMVRELVLDAEVKIKAVQPYRDQYYKSLQYQLGDIVYDIRDSLNRMVQMVQFTERNVTYFYGDYLENIKTYKLIRRMATELENKVIMVQEWQYRRATPEEHHASMREVLRSGAGRDNDDSQELLREGAARVRIARAWGDRPPSPRRAPLAPGDGAKRKNKKWQYVRGYEPV